MISAVQARRIGILHLSDMHISTEGNSEQILLGFSQNFKEETDLLIFSGDVSNRGKEEDKWIPPVKKQGLLLKTCFENDMNLLLVGHSHVSSSYSMVLHDYGNGMLMHVLLLHR